MLCWLMYVGIEIGFMPVLHCVSISGILTWFAKCCVGFFF